VSGVRPECDAFALRLALVTGVGPRTRRELLERFGSPQAVLAASTDDLQRVPGVGPTLSRRIREARDSTDWEQVLATCRQHEIAVMLEDDPDYPPLLREIHDPPGLLFLWGDLLPQDALSVAIVGTRQATSYGQRMAQRLAAELVAAVYSVVSGLARGIDAAAHRGALQAQGRTLAVLGGGLLRLYPPEHTELAAQVRGHGTLLTEAPPERAPSSGNFPQRNRIISGLSLGLIVVEAGLRSGALISAQHALEQGREVFAVPGPIDSPVSRGCHRLLRDGAKLVESVDDVLEELGSLRARATELHRRPQAIEPPRIELSERERRVWDAIDGTATPVDQVIIRSELPAAQVLATLSGLELRHLVRRLSGAFVERGR
jgi:DNA processing protein